RSPPGPPLPRRTPGLPLDLNPWFLAAKAPSEETYGGLPSKAIGQDRAVDNSNGREASDGDGPQRRALRSDHWERSLAVWQISRGRRLPDVLAIGDHARLADGIPSTQRSAENGLHSPRASSSPSQSSCSPSCRSSSPFDSPCRSGCRMCSRACS